MLIVSEPPTVQEMILGFIAGILNKYIGAYFEDIDVSQLTGSIFGGGVTLNNINLRSSIFESLGIPFHVVGGRCGQLEVKYSLTRLYSEPVIVTLKDLYVLIISARGVDYNEESVQDGIQNEKMRQLDIFESVKHHIILTQERKMNKARMNEKTRGSDEAILTTISSVIQNAPQEATYFDMWVMQVLRNIQFHIEGLHIRFEDDVTKPLEPFAVGVFLHSVQVHTTDQDWHSQYVKDYLPETSYKLIKVNGLSLYWNPSPTTLYKKIDDKEKLFEELGKTQNSSDKELNLFFEPVSMELKVQVTPFPDITKNPFSKPRLLIETSLDQFKVNFSDRQFKDIIPFLETLEFLTNSHKYRKFRTGLHDVHYRENYKKWWQFAYDCILDDIQRRRNNFRWDHILEHRKKCHQYLKAYHKRKVDNKPSLERDLVISKLEHELELFMLIILRQHVELIISHANGSQRPSSENISYISWITSWLYPQSPTAEPTTPIKRVEKPGAPNFSVTELTPDDKEIIRVAVGFAKNIDIINYPDDYVALEASLLLNQFRVRIFRLLGRGQETVLDGLLEKVCIELRGRPVNDGLEVEAKMGRVEVYGGDFPPEAASSGDTNAASPLITTANPTVSEYFLKFTYEKNPVDSEVKQRVSLEGLALQFTYLADSIERIAECFAIPGSKRNADVSKSKGNIPATRILRKVMQFRNSPTTKLLRMMDNKGKIELNICLIAPYLVIPQDSTVKGKANFVVVNLGEINLVGTLVGGSICESGTCSHFL